MNASRTAARSLACIAVAVSLAACGSSPPVAGTWALPAPSAVPESADAGASAPPSATPSATPSPPAPSTAAPGPAGLSRPGEHTLATGTVTVTYDVTQAATTSLKAKLQEVRPSLAGGTGLALYLTGGTALNAADLTALQTLGRSAAEGGLGLKNLTRLYVYNLRSLPAGRECTKDSGLACAGQYATGGYPLLYFNGWWESWVKHLVLDDLPDIPLGAFSNTDFATVSFRSARSVGPMAFGHGPHSDLTELHLPNVTKIGHDAFRRNQYLVKVSLPKVVTIDDFAFDDASRLAVFDAPNLVSIGRNALNDAHVLHTVNMPKVEYIGINCFDLNGDVRAGTGVKELRLPKLKTLDKNAITGFASLRLLHAPELTVAWQEAVTDNPSLEEVYAPKLSKIAARAFANNPKLTRLVVAK
ncbi:MAG TPA: leucine-rich repeat domain-containing protein [Micromonosporaceae bacterium]|nr:leucine-rich repeat domain-containing protein [Micromonosporaceae bacterium]